MSDQLCTKVAEIALLGRSRSPRFTAPLAVVIKVDQIEGLLRSCFRRLNLRFSSIYF